MFQFFQQNKFYFEYFLYIKDKIDLRITLQVYMYMETPQTNPLTLTEDDFQLFTARYRKPLKKYLNLWELLPKEIEEYILEYNVIPYLQDIKYGVFNLTDHEDGWADMRMFNHISGEEYHHNRRQEIMNNSLGYHTPARNIKWFLGWDYDENPSPSAKQTECHLRINKLTIDVFTRYRVEHDGGFHFTYVYNRTERKEDIRYYNRKRLTENYLYWLQVCNPNNSRMMLMKYCDLNNIRYRPKTGHKFLVKWLKECAE